MIAMLALIAMIAMKPKFRCNGQQWFLPMKNARNNREINPQAIAEFQGPYADLGEKLKLLEKEQQVLPPLQSFNHWILKSLKLNGFWRNHHRWMEWLGGQPFIGFDSFWWLSTIYLTTEWLHTIVEVYNTQKGFWQMMRIDDLTLCALCRVLNIRMSLL